MCPSSPPRLCRDIALPWSSRRQRPRRRDAGFWRSALFQIQILLAFANPLQPELIRLLVTLRARRPNRRTAFGVEHAELQAGHVGGFSHFAPHRVNFAGQVSLGQTADGRVAGHLADGVRIDGQEQSLAAHPRRRQRRLDPGMAGSDDDDVIFPGINEHGWNVTANGSDKSR